MANALQIANYLIAKASSSDGEHSKLSNLKLQKLLYYVQGFHTVLLKRPAFDDRMEAWMHGPVVPSAYHYYKAYGNGQIPPAMPLEEVDIDDQTAELVDEVFNVYAQHSAWHLRNLSHEEDPWMNRFDSEIGSSEIKIEDLEEFFPSLLE
ncbi:SocA family protein [Halomonas sp. A40-4]|uniref:Panacea domain-containing protein n=1 Tax=Halomonas sp. A40-4 TaxID=2785909 RepID=UPI0018EF73F0|nr:type II toxin-antitoxin system antitoxin SocA domain-containing protein [Halomonas sp. A40-4]QPL46476.1 SocA family protein [Halomonas sp. A40-4]